jgi:preprotein translocase subunit SecF
MLTVLGYSISDTIVVMDRIRSNLKQKINNKLNFSVIINNSINDVFTRSIFTSCTVLIVLAAMFFAGPISIK